MNKEDVEQMAQMEKSYWWHQGKRAIIRSELRRFFPERGGAILDYGCGAGGNFDVLADYGVVDGVDVSEEAIHLCRNKPFRNLQVIVPGQVPSGPYKLIAAFDVMEHVRDDIALLASFEKALEPGGSLLLSVPAYRFLWSEHDEALQHVRRYVASELRAKLTMTGLNVVRVTYAVTFVFPLILAYRLARGFFPKSYERPKVSYIMLPEWLNSLFRWTLVAESKLMRFMNLPFGCSIVAMARKAVPANRRVPGA